MRLVQRHRTKDIAPGWATRSQRRVRPLATLTRRDRAVRCFGRKEASRAKSHLHGKGGRGLGALKESSVEPQANRGERRKTVTREEQRVEFIRKFQDSLAGIVLDAVSSTRSGGEAMMFMRVSLHKVREQLGLVFDELVPDTTKQPTNGKVEQGRSANART